jgi:hypothetical protein
MHNIVLYKPKPSWNKGKLVGQKLPLKLEKYGLSEQCYKNGPHLNHFVLVIIYLEVE